MKKTYYKRSLFTLLLGGWGCCYASVAYAGTEDTTPTSSHHIYYFDSAQGNDKHDGLTDSTAWKSFANIKKTKFQPGDQVLLKRGAAFKERLDFSAQGNDSLPIIVGAYGEGSAKPIISAPDGSRYAVRLYNSDYVTLQHLEIVNHGSKEMGGRTGVLVECKDYGVSKGIRLNDLFVRDVNGILTKKPADGTPGGGSGILISNGNTKGGKISTYDGLTIEYCHIKNCYRNAMIWEGCWDRTNWYANKNVLVRYNLIEKVPGDGIVPIGCDGAIIEYNVMRDCTKMFDENSRREAAAGIWPWSCDNTIIRFNEASDHKAPWDGQGFDADYNCTNTVIEYNYSHDNYGGMVLVCAAGDEAKYEYCWGNEKPIVRYNISIGDGNRPHPARGKMFSPSIHIGGPVNGLNLYRNIVHNEEKAAANIDRSMLISDDWVGCANNTTIKENIFYAPEESGFDFTQSKNNHVVGNYYLGYYRNYPPQQGGLPMSAKNEAFVRDSGAAGLMSLMDSVTIAGGAKCVFVNKKKVEAFFNELIPESKFAAFVEPYFWAEGAVGALPVAETEKLLEQKTVEEAKAYLSTVADQKVKFDDSKYYRIRNYVRDLASGNDKRQGRTGYMGNTSHTDWTKEVAAVSCHGFSMSDASVVWAFEKVGNTDTYKIKNLNSGLYLGKTDANNASKYLKFTEAANAGVYRLEALQDVMAQYQLKCTSGNSSRNQLHASGAGVMNYNTGVNDASSWYLVPATELEVAMAKLGESRYASLHLPFDVSCADETLKFYGVKAFDIEKNVVSIEQMKGVVAGQGAILEGSLPSYTLTINGEVSTPHFENLLKGADEAESIDRQQTYYVLGQDAGAVVGLYKIQGTELVKNEAYLTLPASTSSKGFHFTLDDITGIGNLWTPIEEGRAVYYDLSGRRVLAPVHGVYIVQGKKVYVK